MKRSSRWFGPGLAWVLVAGLVAPRFAAAQDDQEKHGRKYKAPPETAHIEVTVVKGFNKKPIMNAAVIFHPIDANGKDEGTLEVKSGPDGKAFIDVIPIGSQVRVQVLANGFATYAEDFKVDSATHSLTVGMVRPQAQISAYTDNEGKAAPAQPGIQEPARTRKPATPPAAGSSATPPATPPPSTPGGSTAPAGSTPPQP